MQTHRFASMGKKSFNELQVDILRCDDPVDIAVLVPKELITPANYSPLVAPSDKIAAGEDIYFVGYPFADPALNSFIGEDAIGFIRKGILSAIRQSGQTTVLYLDGTNNPGFSGAPVFFRDLMQQGQPYKVAAVVSGYRYAQSDIMKVAPIVRGRHYQRG
jgi:Trypsin-like peptidase domain